MRASRHTAALLLAAGVFMAGLTPAANAYGWGWGEHAGPVYDRPYAGHLHDAASYKDAFARGDGRCVMQRRARPAPRGWSSYTVRVCR